MGADGTELERRTEMTRVDLSRWTALGPDRAPLSVVFVVRDEADRLPDALASVGWADDVIVLDTGSVDATRERAVASGARVVSAPWEGFVASKNRGLGLARHDWVLLLDADERVTPDLRAEIERTLADGPRGGAVGYTMPRLSWFLGRPIRHGAWYPDRVLRLVRRSAGARLEGGRVHERCRVDGPVDGLASPLLHHPYRDLAHALSKSFIYAKLKADDRRESGRRASLAAMLCRPGFEFLRSYVLKSGWRDGGPGLVAALLHANSYFLTAALAYDVPPPRREPRLAGSLPPRREALVDG